MIRHILHSLIYQRKDLQPEQFLELRYSFFDGRKTQFNYRHGNRSTSSLKSRLKKQHEKPLIQQQLNIQEQLNQFWSAQWNRALIIQPDSLAHLSRFVDYRLKKTIELLKIQKGKFSYNHDTLIAWLFFQWLHLAKSKQNIWFSEALPNWFRKSFTQRMQLTKHSATQKNASNKEEELKVALELKAAFSKALGEGLLNACLDDEIQQIIFGRKPTQTQMQELFTTTNLLIELGNHLEIWDLCFVNSIVLQFHEKNPFADENEWKRALRFEKSIQLIQRAHQTHSNDIEFLHARVLISLMMDSFILDEAVLKETLEQLNSPSELQRIGKQISLFISTDTKGDKLLFISPITEIYYRQYLKECLAKNKKFALSLDFPSKDFYQILGQSAHTLKLRTFKSWKHSIKTYLQLKGTLSPMGLAYAVGEIPSHPFLPKTLTRYFNFACQSNSQALQGENFEEHGRLPRSYLWSKLRASLDEKHISPDKEYEIRQEIKYRIRQLISDSRFSSNEGLIAEYALARIDKSHGYEALSPSTILTHIDAFGLPLILSAGAFELRSISEKKRQTIYLNCLDIEQVKPKRFLYYLKMFEDWLRVSYTSLKLESFKVIPDYDEIFADVRRPEFFVDANVLTFEDYEQVKKELIKAYLDSDGQRLEFLQAAILLILGFKLDLRRSEGVFLEGKDYVFDETQPNLFIRAHDKRSLKTDNAKRDYYLEEHLDASEIQLFNEYLQKVKLSLNVDVPKYFFPEKKTTLTPPHRITQPLLATIKKVTGDGDFKFHNLRHSKASWDMLAIFNAQFELGVENSIFAHLPKTVDFLATANTRWQSAVHSNDSIHKAPFYLHRQMGHGSLMTTFKNYIHTMDFVLAGFQKKHALATLSIEYASQLGILKKSSLYKEAKKESFSITEYLLNRILPWTPFEKREDDKEEVIHVNDLHEEKLSTNNIENDNEYPSVDGLLPIKELQKLKCFRLFELLHYHHLQDMDNELDTLKALGLSTEDKKEVLKHFKEYKFARMKMPANDMSIKRLIVLFSGLPKELKKAIFQGSFWVNESFSAERKLIEKCVDRMSFKMENSKEPMSLIKEVDIICNHFDEALPIIKLVRLLNWQIKCRFMSPKKGGYSWQDWQEQLNMTEEELSKESVVKSMVTNSYGRLTIRLKKIGKTETKFSEQYLLLSILRSYQIFQERFKSNLK